MDQNNSNDQQGQNNTGSTDAGDHSQESGNSSTPSGDNGTNNGDQYSVDNQERNAGKG